MPERGGIDKGGSQPHVHFAYVAHHIPGRIRIRVPAGKRNPEFLHQVAQAAEPVPKAKSIETNPVTGSVLIHYDRSGFADFLQALSKALEGILILADPEAAVEEEALRLLISGPSQTATAVAGFFRNIDREVKVATGNAVDLRLLVPLVAIAISLTFVGESMSTPMWMTLAIFSMNSFLQLNPT